MLLTGLVLPGWLVANELSRADHVVSLDEAIRIAINSNPDYLNMADQVELANLDYDDARSVYQTKFASNASSDARWGAETGSFYNLYLNKKNESGSAYSVGMYNNTYGDRTLAELRFSYTLPFFKNPLDNAQLRVAQTEIDVMQQQRMKEIGSEELVHAVVQAYYRLALALRNEALAADKYQIATKSHRARQLQSEHGELSGLELETSALNLVKAEQQQQNVAFQRQQAEDNLKVLMGMNVTRDISIDPQINLNVDEKLIATPIEKLEAIALAERIELEAKSEQLMMDKRYARSVEVGVVPPIEVTLQYALVGEGDSWENAIGFDDQRIGVGLSMNTDFGSVAQKKKQTRAEIRFRTHEREYEQLKNRIKMDVRKAHFQVRQSESELGFSTRELQLAENRHRQAQLMFQQGKLSDLQLLESEQILAEAGHGALVARVNYVLASQQLAKATGKYTQQWSF